MHGFIGATFDSNTMSDFFTLTRFELISPSRASTLAPRWMESDL